MTWLWILLGIIAVVFIISKLGGESNEDALGNAAGAGYAAGSCMFQIFIFGIVIVVAIFLFGWLFS